MIQWDRSETLRRAQRDVSRARSARETNGGSGGPPPEIFIKKQVNGANLDHPGYFFNKLLSTKLIPFYTVIFGNIERNIRLESENTINNIQEQRINYYQTHFIWRKKRTW